jgi:uncharacterized protein YjgD (DUF1641 family)
MGEKIQVKSTNGNEKLAAQIDEIYAKIDFIENLLNDLKPAFEKISKDIQPTIKDLREKFERDESLELVKKVGDNIPTFLTLMNLMDTVKGMIEDLAPVIEKISRDAHPTIKDLRERFEREETLELVKKVGDNIPTFLTLINLIGTVKGMLEDIAPVIEKISSDAHPTIKGLRERYEREETLELIKKVGDNIPTFLTLINLMDTAKGMIEDIAPVMGKISKDTMPTVNMLRESFEKEETLELLRKTGENITTFNKLMDFLNKFEKTGTLDFTLENVLTSEMNCLIKGMEKCAVISMKHIMENPIKPGIKNVISAMRDPEVQKGLLMMTIFAKNLSQGMSEAIKECK